MTPVLRNGRRALLALLTLAVVACDPSDACDPGYHEVHGACYPNDEPEPDDDASIGDGDGDGDDGGAEPPDAAPPSDPYEGFGDPCERMSDCPSGLICGAPMLPICTQVNCEDDDSGICPPDWTCLDISAQSPDPSVTEICLGM